MNRAAGHLWLMALRPRCHPRQRARASTLDRTAFRVYAFERRGVVGSRRFQTVSVQVLLAIRVLTRTKEHGYERGAVIPCLSQEIISAGSLFYGAAMKLRGAALHQRVAGSRPSSRRSTMLASTRNPLFMRTMSSTPCVHRSPGSMVCLSGSTRS